MTQQLREALHDLAEEEPGPAVSGDDLWRRGRRAARRRRAATAAAVVAVVVVVAGGVPVVDSLRTTAPGPAAPRPGTEASVPDQLWSPRPWTPGTAQTGPPGRLAAIAIGDRKGWWPGDWAPGVFGVTAEDQTYRWLDLPDRTRSVSFEAPAVVLSPDGRKVGYFLGGEPSGSVTQSDVVGYAVYDLVTGEVTRRTIPTRHGLAVGEGGLAWSGDSEWLVSDVGQYRAQRGSSHDYRVEAWRAGDDARVRVAPFDGFAGSGLAPAPEGVARWRGKRLQTVLLPSGDVRVERYPRGPSVMVTGSPVVSPDRTRLAFVDGRPHDGGSLAALHVARVGDGPETAVRELAKGWYAEFVLGWVDETTVLVQGFRNYPAGDLSTKRIVAVDVERGSVSPGIGRPASYDDFHGEQLATDLLTDGLAPGQAPGWHVPPWPVSLAGLLLLGGLGWLMARALRRRGERALETRDTAGPAEADAS